ncbi:MAG TPA: hypothetical protein VFM82_03515 [Flavobacteriaceae bacterium]|nr:hypothetical protein [Flavobacteriaceae bacterium]
MATVAELINGNMGFFDRLVRAGKVSLTVKQEIDIYQYWLSTTGKKMQRYSETSEAMGVSERTVIRAVKEMKKVV